MQTRSCTRIVMVALLLAIPVVGGADFRDVARCQRRIAGAGANFARITITSLVKCEAEIVECQVQCEEGVFGPPCHSNPPPCCDPDDPESNPGFGECMADAEKYCDRQADRIDQAEVRKQDRITNACDDLTLEELCGAETSGLHFAILDAGCEALIPGYQCSLESILECVGGPRERDLADEIGALLAPRAEESLGILDLQGRFPGIPVARKVTQQLEPGKADVWSITGEAGDLVRAAVLTMNDSGDGSATLDPGLTLLGMDGTTPLGDTTVVGGSCPIPQVCGGTCPKLRRRLPFSGTFFVAVHARTVSGCSGGQYRLVVATPTGVVPTLVSDDIDATLP